ncbi:hypothetical protein OG331_51310 [Streptomyces sp. NBC_01017]|uniref:Transposase n=1 Tax=Streptomyces sp. NBC_00180 TaxID=2903632 RepID=A0AAU1HQP1_9ACTN|nr:hypothetical protein OG331_00660 [Streptomyces sp. NBC_01017]WSV35296.1 hypothetical protein OG331_51310 [Streptomyces sp. NBC_01017]
MEARHPSVSGYQGTYAMREIVNAILYQNRTDPVRLMRLFGITS